MNNGPPPFVDWLRSLPPPPFDWLSSPRVAILGKSNLSKNCNLNLLNWSSERNSVHCFSTVFTLLQQQEVPSTCQPRIV